MTRYYHDSLVLSTAAASDPVSLAEAKAHMYVDTSADDSYITTLITTATKYAQKYQGRQYVNATWVLYLSDFPSEILVPLSPLSSVTSLAYTDTDGNSQTLVENTDFVVDTNSEPGRIMPERSTSGWPDVQSDIYNGVTLTFVAGYGATGASVPEHIKHAIMILVAHWYENREPVIVGQAISKVPTSVNALLDVDRMWAF